ncbi:MAG: ArsR family transcriptional regulator [Candidatus Thorarchaeota archaeon]|nr:ArsR family transcriptional regulator [Candidatus Thorarchaeota archaeon]
MRRVNQYIQTITIIKDTLSNVPDSCEVLQLSESLLVSDEDAILRIGRALSSKTRLKILKLLLEKDKDANVTEVARHLGGTEANASAQIKILYDAGLLECRYEPGQHGLKKISKTKIKKITIDLD